MLRRYVDAVFVQHSSTCPLGIRTQEQAVMSDGPAGVIMKAKRKDPKYKAV
jgi:hypothetical protein